MTTLTGWEITLVVLLVIAWLFMSYLVAAFVSMVFDLGNVAKWVMFVFFFLIPPFGSLALFITLVYVVFVRPEIMCKPATPVLLTAAPPGAPTAAPQAVPKAAPQAVPKAVPQAVPKSQAVPQAV